MNRLMSLLAVFCLLAGSAAAQTPNVTQGDIELDLSGDVARLFNSEVTGFDLGTGIGYFVTDWLEIGVAGTVSYLTGDEARSGNIDMQTGLTSRSMALTSGPATSGVTGWSGSVEGFARIFPFASSGLLPPMLAPFLGIEFGSLFTEDLDPFLVASASIGLHIHIVKSVAITPEVGYGMVAALDDQAKFGGEDIEHVIAFNWGVSVFF
jgi:hypothetical protein